MQAEDNRTDVLKKAVPSGSCLFGYPIDFFFRIMLIIIPIVSPAAENKIPGSILVSSGRLILLPASEFARSKVAERASIYITPKKRSISHL